MARELELLRDQEPGGEDCAGHQERRQVADREVADRKHAQRHHRLGDRALPPDERDQQHHPRDQRADDLGAHTDASANGNFVGPYSNATADDQGRFLVARQFRAQDGQSQATFWIWSDATGKQLATPAIVKMSYCGFPADGPIGARLHPSGTWFTFWYICEYGSPSWGHDLRAQVNIPGSILQGPEWSGYWQPSWYGNRLTASNEADGGIQADDPSAPLVTNLTFNLWVAHASFTVAAQTGAHKVRFAGRISPSKKLRPGTYTVTVTATSSSGRRSTPHLLSFTIVN